MIVRYKDKQDLLMENEKPNEAPSVDNMYEPEYRTLSPIIQGRYYYDPNRQCYRMMEPEWLKQRQHWVHYDDEKSPDYVRYTLTGSEAGTVMVGTELMESIIGKDEKPHSFRCKSALWYEKKGIDTELKKADNKQILEGGHIFEDVSLQICGKLIQQQNPEDVVEVVANKHMFQCGRKNDDGTLKYPWALADTDGDLYINGHLESIIECKNISRFSPEYKLVKKKKIPFLYYIQGMHYMFVRNVPSVHYVFCTGNSYPDDFIILYLERDLHYEEWMVRLEQQFIDSLHNDVEPVMDGSDHQDLQTLYEYWRCKMGNFDEDERNVELDSSLFEVVEELSFIEQDIVSLKEQIDKLTEKKEKLLVQYIFPKVGKANAAIVPFAEDSAFKVTFKADTGKRSLDEEAIKAYNPKIYESCMVRKFSSAVFREKYPELVKQFAIRGRTLTDEKKTLNKIQIVRRTG